MSEALNKQEDTIKTGEGWVYEWDLAEAEERLEESIASVVWSSSDAAVATVSDDTLAASEAKAKVTAVAAGSCRIRALCTTDGTPTQEIALDVDLTVE